MVVTPVPLGKSPVNFFNIDPIAGGMNRCRILLFIISAILYNEMMILFMHTFS